MPESPSWKRGPDRLPGSGASACTAGTAGTLCTLGTLCTGTGAGAAERAAMAGGLRGGVRALGALGAALVGAAAGAGAAPAKEFVGQYVHSLPGPIANMRVADALLMIMCTLAALFGGGILFMVTNLLKDLNVQPALDKKRKEWVEFPLAEVVQLNHNTKLLRFRLGRHNQPLGLPTGQHLKILAEDADGEEVARRAYTPTSGQDVVGHFDLVIKVYPNGAMTQHMDKMKVGDKLKFRGPQGHFKYERNMKRSIGMVAGGTGITPMVSALAAAPRDSGSGGPALTPPPSTRWPRRSWRTRRTPRSSASSSPT